MTNELSQTPKTLTAGDSVSWRLSLPEYPASEDWVIIYAFVNTGSLIAVESTPDEEDHTFSITSTKSAAYQPGRYKFQAYAKKGEQRTTFLTGTLDVNADFFAQTDGHDSRTAAERTLDILRATYDRVAEKALASKSSGGASIADKQLSELRAEIKEQEVVVLQEKRARARKLGKGKSSTIKVRF